MKILIAYYSRTGNTEKLAESIKKEFELLGHSVDLEKIKPKREHSFWGWFLIRLFRGECEIEEPKIKDVSKYDAICIGSPNWTKLSLPVARYLREIKGLEYKNIGFFSTTALWPIFEWYILSAYFLDFTFSRIMNQKKGRIVASILLSSVFKNFGLQSPYEKKQIKDFCKKIETFTFSFKDYFLEKKDVEENRIFVAISSATLVFSLFFQIIFSKIKFRFLSLNQFFSLFFVALFFFLLTLFLLVKKKNLFLGRYLVGIFLTLEWTQIVLFFTPTFGRFMILGYILIFIFIGFFRDPNALLFTGFITLLEYNFLLFFFAKKEIFFPKINLTLLFSSLALIFFTVQNSKKQCIDLLQVQDEITEAKSVLEIKVKARTKELEELAASLDEKVKEKTKELQEKVNELEKFYKLAVGRELKMVELKEEIKKLREELEKERKSKLK